MAAVAVHSAAHAGSGGVDVSRPSWRSYLPNLLVDCSKQVSSVAVHSGAHAGMSSVLWLCILLRMLGVWAWVYCALFSAPTCPTCRWAAAAKWLSSRNKTGL
eukprot:scaffold122633_cov20-Tisochrysis_lutea.AAC.1